MLKLDQFSESILFQCDRCQHVGEILTDLVEDEGAFYCWGCLGEMKNQKVKRREVDKKTYVL